MGHYDDIHTTEREHAIIHARRKLLKQYVRLDKAMEELKSAVWATDDANLKSAEKNLDTQFVLWCSKKGLLVEDPQIVIDLLKDEK